MADTRHAGATQAGSAPSFPQVAQMQLASDELFKGIHQITENELIGWYQEEFARHPERMRILEALCGVKGAMLTR